MTLKRSFACRPSSARARAVLACSIEVPCIDPDVSMTKIISRGIKGVVSSPVSGGMTISSRCGSPPIVSLNAIARGAADATGRHRSSKSWSIAAVDPASSTV